jgi:RNA polymerase sigma-70 factor (ECF subfamily)
VISYTNIPGVELFRHCAGSTNRDAWAEFQRRYHPTIAGVIVRTLASYGSASTHDVEDLIHEVYLRLCGQDGKALRNFLPAGAQSDFAYLKVIARNVVTDQMTRRGKNNDTTPLEGGPIELAAGDVTGSARAIDRTVLIGEIHRILCDGANDRDRRIFWLHYRAGLTAEEISCFRTIELTAKGVESVLHRLTKLVRTKLAGQTASEGKS